MNWDKFDELFASFARPWQMYFCATSVAFALPMALYLKAGDVVIGALAAAATTIATGTAYFRTVDIKTKTVAATEDKKTAAQTIPPVPIKTSEVS